MISDTKARTRKKPEMARTLIVQFIIALVNIDLASFDGREERMQLKPSDRAVSKERSF